MSTGEASLIADQAPQTGIDLPDVPPETRERLLRDLPTLGYIGNPLDPWGATDPPTAYAAAFGAFASSGAYDVLALVHDFPYRSLPSEVETALEVTEPLLDATRDRPELLPVFVSLTSGEPTPEIVDRLREAGGVPLLRGGAEAFTAIASLARWEDHRERRLADGPTRDAWRGLANERTFVGHAAPIESEAPRGRAVAERESLGWLGRAGVPVVETIAAADADGAAAAAARLGFPVVVKLDASGLAHKSDIGGVVTAVADVATARAAAARLLELDLPAGVTRRGVLVSRQLAGLELILGGRRDPSFGPIVLAGLGGVLAEALDDVAVRLAPVRAADADAMLRELRGAAILDGVRGGPAIDREAVIAAIVAIGRLLAEDETILEIDANPVISGPGGTAAVDALVVERAPGT